MMNTLPKIVGCCLLIVVMDVIGFSKDWRSIVPLKSTRSDVERLLGKPKQSSRHNSYYSLPGEIVVFHFQVLTCNEDRLGFTWNIPAGTVISIGVIPKGKHQKEEYLKPGTFKTGDVDRAFVYYTNETEGLSVETQDSLVTLVEYHPGASQSGLRCPQVDTCCADFMRWFDQYGNISFADQKARLDNFTFELNALSSRAVIEVIGPTKKIRDDGLKAAAKAKAYLVKRHHFEPGRILIVNGGYGPELLTGLAEYSIGGVKSRIYISPQPDPAKGIKPIVRLYRLKYAKRSFPRSSDLAVP